MGIEIGSKLLFTKDSTVEAIVCGDKIITYQGGEKSLTTTTKKTAWC